MNIQGDESLEETIKNCLLSTVKKALFSKKFSPDHDLGYDSSEFYLKLSKKLKIKVLVKLSENNEILTVEFFNDGELDKYFSDDSINFKDEPFLKMYNNLNSQVIKIEMFFGKLLENKRIFIKQEEFINKNIFINLFIQKIYGVSTKQKKKIEKENAKIEKQKDENL